MKTLERAMLAVILFCAVTTCIAQAYHAGYRAGYHAIETESNQE